MFIDTPQYQGYGELGKNPFKKLGRAIKKVGKGLEAAATLPLNIIKRERLKRKAKKAERRGDVEGAARYREKAKIKKRKIKRGLKVGVAIAAAAAAIKFGPKVLAKFGGKAAAKKAAVSGVGLLKMGGKKAAKFAAENPEMTAQLVQAGLAPSPPSEEEYTVPEVAQASTGLPAQIGGIPTNYLLFGVGGVVLLFLVLNRR